MVQALQRLRELAALEVRAIASETRVDVSESLEITSKLSNELVAIREGKSIHNHVSR